MTPDLERDYQFNLVRQRSLIANGLDDTQEYDNLVDEMTWQWARLGADAHERCLQFITKLNSKEARWPAPKSL